MTMCFLTGCAAEKEEADAENKGDVTTNTSAAPEESGESEESGVELPEGEYSFVFLVEDKFVITGEGLVATGLVESGKIGVGDKVILLKADGTQIETKVNKLEMFRKELDEIVEGDYAGVYLEGMEREDVEAGDKLFVVAGEEESFLTEDTKVLREDNIGSTFVIEDHYTKDEYAYASGTVESGIIYPDDDVILVKADGTEIKGSVIRLEQFNREVKELAEGEIAAIVLSGIISSDMERGDKLVVVSKPKEDNYTFVFDVEGSFDLSEKGLVVVGKVEAGEAAVGDAVVLLKADGTQKETIINALESASDGEVEKISEGDAAGVYLEGITKEDIGEGDKLVIYAEE